jgi:tetratricopeptide (TPR) repeat protein
LYNATEKHELAIGAFNKALTISPEHYSIRRERAKAFAAINEHQAAIDDLTWEIQRFSSAYSLDLEPRADSYCQIGDFNKAVEDYSRIIEWESRYSYGSTLARILKKRGECYRLLHEDEKARADFDRAAELGKKDW